MFFLCKNSKIKPIFQIFYCFSVNNHGLYQIFSHNNNFLFGAKVIFLSDINDKYPIILSFIYYNLLIIDYKLITDY